MCGFCDPLSKGRPTMTISPRFAPGIKGATFALSRVPSLARSLAMSLAVSLALSLALTLALTLVLTLALSLALAPAAFAEDPMSQDIDFRNGVSGTGGVRRDTTLRETTAKEAIVKDTGVRDARKKDDWQKRYGSSK
jgi:pentapeptide MXKDX repeat protein